jgi:hypothetical protein
MIVIPGGTHRRPDPKDVVMLKRILWALVPVIASRVLNNRRGSQAPRANKTRYNGKYGK